MVLEFSYLYYTVASLSYICYISTALLLGRGTRKTYVAAIINLVSVVVPSLVKHLHPRGVGVLENLTFWWFASFALAPCFFLGVKGLQDAETGADYSSTLLLFWLPFVFPNLLFVWVWRTVSGLVSFLTPSDLI